MFTGVLHRLGFIQAANESSSFCGVDHKAIGFHVTLLPRLSLKIDSCLLFGMFDLDGLGSRSLTEGNIKYCS
jgi:hypothetical protein